MQMASLGSRIVITAFDGWNDAGEAASGVISHLRAQSGYELVHRVDPELYFDYQYTRPSAYTARSGQRKLRWPDAALWRPKQATGGRELWLLTGVEPARAWKAFAAEFMDIALREDVTGLVTLGAMLSDVPHTRPISVYASSQNDEVRGELGLDKALYEGPVGILSVIEHYAESAGIPTATLWASVPHYVASAMPSSKASLALLSRLEEVTETAIEHGDLDTAAATWEATIDAAAADDDDMAEYIRDLERTRDTWDSPEASGDAIAREFEKYLRRRSDPPEGKR